MIKSFLSLFFSQAFFEKLFAFVCIVLVGYALRDFLALFLITFIFAYLFLEFWTFLAQKAHDWWLHGSKTRAKQIAAQYGTTNILVTILYIFFIIVLTFIFVSIVPKIGIEIEKLAGSAPKLAEAGTNLIRNVEANIGLDLGAEEIVSGFLSETNIQLAGQQALFYIRDAGSILLKFLLGILLSYVFIIERNHVSQFFRGMQNGSFAFLYREYRSIASKIAKGFGLIFKAQSVIALVNAIFTSVWLTIIGILTGHGGFPYIFTLSLIVFIFGFIPVFGTILSGIPIILIAYGHGGFDVVLGVIIMIILVHALEAYILNPKIVSSYVHFPVFITFLVLIISEHLFGLVGLLIGIPLFSILIDLFDDLDTYISSIRRKVHDWNKS